MNFQLTGLFLLLVGVWAELDLYKYLELSPEFSGTAPHVIIGISGLIILISSIAFSCIIKGQPVLLYIVSYKLMTWFVRHVSDPILLETPSRPNTEKIEALSAYK